MAPMTNTAKRRWSFSLRTLFLTVTAFACWLGYELNWIRERHALLDDNSRWMAYEASVWGKSGQYAPGMLWLLGEKGYESIYRRTEAPDEDAVIPDRIQLEIRQAERLFPEASEVGLVFGAGGAEPEGGYWQ